MSLPRYVELVRVSGEQQAARDTPADQRAALDKLRLARPGILVERIEEGASGLSGALPLNKRPDLMRLFALAKARSFDEVRVRHLDRLTRHPDPRERYAIYGAVMDASAVIVDASGHVIDPASEMGELDFAFNSIVAARERKRILERTVTARRRHAAEGQFGGRPPYGRTYDRKTKAWGEDPAQIKVFRRIFKEVIAGRSLATVAAGLQSDNIPTPAAKNWTKRKGAKGGTGKWTSGIVGHLLKGRAATGTVTYMGQEMRCPPVVDEATFKRAREAVALQTSGKRPSNPADALLRNLAVCGACGAPMWVQTGAHGEVRYRYYVCRFFRTSRTKECKQYHRVSEVDPVAREALLKWLAAEVAPVAGDATAPQPRRSVEALEAKLKALAAEEGRLLRAARLASPEAAEAALMELAGEREGLKRELEIAKLPPPPAPARATAAERSALLKRAKKATPGALRTLVLTLLAPGDARIMPGGRLELRASRLPA
jgi:DNA invertase Pin-like site-specific DNA recombinase